MIEFFITDLSSLEVVHESNRAAMDSENFIHRPNLRVVFVDLSDVLQQRELLRVLLHSTRLLRGFCNIQFPVVMLRVPGRRGQYYVGDSRQADTF